MSIIKIRGRSDPIFRPYHIAKMIKQKKFGDDVASPPIQKVTPDSLCDLGDEWSGTYGQIISIELNDKPQPVQIEEESTLSPEQEKSRRKAIDETSEWLRARGIIHKKEELKPKSEG